jgi:oxysterol-binding protein-related protein 9/10/11
MLNSLYDCVPSFGKMPFVSSSLSQLSQMKDFIAYLGTVKGDLSHVTAPPFILAPKSAIEIPSVWALSHRLFLSPSREPDASRRALLVLQNYVCSLRHLAGEDAAKKPMNPFLGELFVGAFRDDGDGAGSDTQLVAEQVSHHPPVTACHIRNGARGVSSSGFVAQEMSFSLSDGVTVRQHGFALVRDERHGESHLMTMPTLRIRGLASGRTHVELEGPCYISSSSGFLSRIDLGKEAAKGSSGGGGSRARVSAEVFRLAAAGGSEAEEPAQQQKQALFKATGRWDGKLTFRNHEGDVVDELHVDRVPTTPLSVRPVEEQSERESRRAWSSVFDGIREGNFDKVRSHKEAIEKAQRRQREEERTSGTTWQSKFFSRHEQDDDAVSLLRRIPDPALQRFDPTRTNGFWKWKEGPAA